LIGFRGRNISQIMDKYHVDIRFSKSDSSNPDLVVVYAREDATQDDVLDCMDYLEMIQQDYVIAFTLYFIQSIFLYCLWTLLNNMVIYLYFIVFLFVL